MHGGHIRVESQVGKGSAFTVSLPCEAAPAHGLDPAPARNDAAMQSAAQTSSARLLLVEDNLVNQKVVLAILRKKGYQIEVANDGREALTKLEIACSKVRSDPDGCADAGARRAGSDAHAAAQSAMGREFRSSP